MKYTGLLLLCLLSLLNGCDVIGRGDYQVDYSPPIPEGADKQFMLLEDFTGMRCVNCPAAALQAALLKETFGERLIVVAIHAGANARPLNGIDLRTPAGDTYYTSFAISGAPWGMVNRTPYEGKPYFEVGKWAGAIAAAPLSAAVSIGMKIDYHEQDRTYAVHLDLMRLNASVQEGIELILWLVEDSIVTPQLTDTGEGWVQKYVQRHVLRGALNGTWGERVFIPSIGTPVLVEKEFILPEGCKANDCSVVALLCESGSKRVVQVGECQLVD